MQAQKVRFVVASGNQYPHLPQYFTGLTGDITYLTEDGAHIVSNGQTISEDVIPHTLLKAFLNWMSSQPYSSTPGAVFGSSGRLDGNPASRQTV